MCITSSTGSKGQIEIASRWIFSRKGVFDIITTRKLLTAGGQNQAIPGGLQTAGDHLAGGNSLPPAVWKPPGVTQVSAGGLETVGGIPLPPAVSEFSKPPAVILDRSKKNYSNYTEYAEYTQYIQEYTPQISGQAHTVPTPKQFSNPSTKERKSQLKQLRSTRTTLQKILWMIQTYITNNLPVWAK